jgi:tetratricopeptide (TPR) repeat protein
LCLDEYNYLMRTLLQRILRHGSVQALILLAVIGLVFTPPILTGYNELRRADSELDAGNFSDAADRYKRIVRLLPWRNDLFEQMAMAQAFTGEFDSAILSFEQAKEQGVLSAEGWDLLGQSHWWKGDRESALASWNEGVEVYPTYARFYAHLSMAYYEQGELFAEQNALEQWVAADGETDPAAHYRLGLLLSVFDFEQALGELLLASSLDPEYDPAVETMRTALSLASLETEESNRLILIGRGLGLVSEWPLAAEAFRQAVGADGENAEAWAWLGEAEQQLGRDGRAELDQAVEIDPRNPIVRSLRGLYWMRQGDGERALTEYQLAALHDPDNPAWQISIGEAYVLSGDLQAALIHYQRATEIAPTDATVWRALANFSAQYNVQIEDVGLPAAQMAVEITGEGPLALDTLGLLLTLLERYDEARDTLEHALSLDPDLAQGHLHLGIVNLQTDDWKAAKSHFQQARDLDLDGPVGEQAQILLNQYFP